MTVNEPTYFRVTGKWYDVEAPSTSGTTNAPQFLVVSAFVTFTARLAPGTSFPISNLDLGANIAPPTLLGTASSTGGTLAAGTYYYVATATDANGETTKSNEISKTVTGSTSSVALSWPQVDGATGYKIYRGTTASSENVLLTTISSGSTLTYTDTGSAGTSATPPSTNTAEASANANLFIAPVAARILQGELQTINTEDTPDIHLLANTTILGLDTLIYDVSFSNVVYASAGRTIKNFAFTAPTTAGQVIDLADPALTRLPYNPSGY